MTIIPMDIPARHLRPRSAAALLARAGIYLQNLNSRLHGNRSLEWAIKNSAKDSSGRPMLKWLWISVLVVVVDQATKWMASAWLEPNAPYPLLSWFNFNLTHNTGAAFSFLSAASG